MWAKYKHIMNKIHLKMLSEMNTTLCLDVWNYALYDVTTRQRKSMGLFFV